MARVYVASSWRNETQPEVVSALRIAGHEVYDFRDPEHNAGGFHWSEIDGGWQSWTAIKYRHHLLSSPICAQGYMADFRAMEWADTCVLVLPCGRSAHLEAGWFAGRGKRTILYLNGDHEPELMSLMLNNICITLNEVVDLLEPVVPSAPVRPFPLPPTPTQEEG